MNHRLPANYIFRFLLYSFAFMGVVFTGLAQDHREQDKTPFPQLGKKGLQVQMVEDALALGIKHAGVNVSLGAMLELGESDNTVPHDWEGKRYSINRRYIESLDVQIKPLSDHGVAVYLILLAYPTKNPTKDALLIHPDARADGQYTIAGFNTKTEPGLQTYRALLSYLAQRYSAKATPNGRVWGWIIGNEVNSQWLWYNLGLKTLEETVEAYEKAVRNAHQILRIYSAHARCYLSFDHHWNTSMPGISEKESYKSRDFIDTFATTARKGGDYDWHVALHPYPDDLGNPRTWLDKAAPPHFDAKHITFKNLEMACRYLLKPELLWQGKPRRIILSEQGFHCLATPEGETLQAAAFAYAWEKTARLEGVDAFIWHRHVDHAQEGGLRLGLWTNVPGSIATPERKRLLYELFRKADTPEWTEAAKFALPITGLSTWDELPR